MKTKIVLIFSTLLSILIVSCKEDSITSPGSSPAIFIAQFQQGVLPSPSFAGITDSYISSASPFSTFSDCPELKLGFNGSDTCRILFSCDLTIIPSQAKILKAYLTFVPHYITAQTLYARSYMQSTFWTPGSGCGSRWVGSYEARWYGPWTPYGGDTTNQMSNIASITYPLTSRGLNFELDTAVVQKWVKFGVSTAPDANNGLMIKSLNESMIDTITVFSSVNTSLVQYRPVLTVYYTIPF